MSLSFCSLSLRLSLSPPLSLPRRLGVCICCGCCGVFFLAHPYEIVAPFQSPLPNFSTHSTPYLKHIHRLKENLFVIMFVDFLLPQSLASPLPPARPSVMWRRVQTPASPKRTAASPAARGSASQVSIP